MEKRNIFQGHNGIRETIAKSLGYLDQLEPRKPLPDVFPKKYERDFCDFVENYNHEVVRKLISDRDSFCAKHGQVYSNTYTKRALRTLRQFLNNMLVPIWVRDVPYNIKGKCDNSIDCNNIKIELL